LTSRPPLTPGRKRPGPAKSHAGRGKARVASPPNRKPKDRTAEIAVRNTGRTAKRPQIPAIDRENTPPGKRGRIPANGGQNAPSDEKSPESRKAEKAVAKISRNSKRPQIPAFLHENSPPGKRGQIPANGGQNAPPDEKSPENRKAEIAVAKISRNSKRPQIPAFLHENSPPGKRGQIPANGGQNANPALALINDHPRTCTYTELYIIDRSCYTKRMHGPYIRLRFRAHRGA
jgi:hypothetical protein